MSTLVALIVLMFGSSDYVCTPGKLDTLFEDGSYRVSLNTDSVLCIDAIWRDDGTIESGYLYTVWDTGEVIGFESVRFERGLPFPESLETQWFGYREDFLSIVQ